MLGNISHDRADESLEAKARWFQSLPLERRMDLLCEFTDLIFELQPNIAEPKNVKPIPGRICILNRP